MRNMQDCLLLFKISFQKLTTNKSNLLIQSDDDAQIQI